MIKINRSNFWISGLLVISLLAQGEDAFAQKRGKSNKKSGATPDVIVAPNSSSDLYFEALKARLKDNDDEAERLLLQFVRTNPKESAGYYDLARLSFKNGKSDQALNYIKKALELDGENKWYREQYAHILASANQFEASAKVFEQLAKDEKHNQDYLLLASRLYQRAGKYKESLQVLNKLIEKTGEDESILLQKQQIYLRMNDLESATNIIRQLIQKNPKESRYYSILAELYENNDQDARADEIYRDMERLFPEDPSTQLSLALFYKKKKDQEKYESYVEKAITNKELDAETQISLLLPYLQELSEDSSRLENATMLAAELARQHPDNGQVQGFYGDVLIYSGKKEEGLEQYKKAVDVEPSRFNLWQQLLFNYSEPDQADSLIRYSEKALTYFPNHALIHYLNAIGNYHAKKYPTAVKSLNRAIEVQPEDETELLTDIYSILGDLYHLLKEHKLSDSCYDKALQLAPDNASVLNNYSYYLAERGERLDDAERMSKKSLVLRPNEPTFLDTYGWILYKKGDYEKAESFIRKALELREDSDGVLWEHLGDIKYRQGNVEEAVKYWETAKLRGSENTQLDKKIKDKKLYE